jgi:signal transduction histidine kinase
MVGNLDAEVAHAVPTGWSTRELPHVGTRVTARIYASPVPEGFGIIVGRDVTDRAALRASLLEALATGAILSLAVAILASLTFNWLIRSRLERVASTARGIVAGDLSARVTVDGSGDAFDNLAGTLNAMLDRIQQLMDGMRQVSNDIAHDLRTPLTRLRQRLEHAKRRATSVEELHEALTHSIAQVDSILETFGALLRIAQIEAGGRTGMKMAVDVSKLLSGIAEDFAPAAEDQGQRLVADIDPQLRAEADPELLTQMVVNLIENAIRHSPPGAKIWVQAKSVGDGLELAVSDTGPGIPLQEREKVLRPFYRLEASRTTQGSGLGLSLVAAIAKRHDAKLSLSDNAPGLRVAVVLPAAA